MYDGKSCLKVYLPDGQNCTLCLGKFRCFIFYQMDFELKILISKYVSFFVFKKISLPLSFIKCEITDNLHTFVM